MPTSVPDWRICLLLRHRSGDVEVREFRQRKIVFGRSPQCDVALDTDNCSRRHCWIYVSEDEQLRIADGESTNGTFVNGRPVHDAPFERGDRLYVGYCAVQLLNRAGPGDRPSQVLVVRKGPQPGRMMVMLDTQVTLGRGSSVDLRLDDPSVSHRHAQVTEREGSLTVSDLESRDGVRVNGRLVGAEPTTLGVGDVIELGDVQLCLEERDLEPSELLGLCNDQLRERDPMTGMRSRWGLENALRTTYADASPLSVVVLCISERKRLSDYFGHRAVDYLFCDIARHCQRVAEGQDAPIIARHAEHGLAIVLLGDAAVARGVAQDLREAVREASFVFEGRWIDVQVNTAFVERSGEHSDPEALLKAGVEALSPG